MEGRFPHLGSGALASLTLLVCGCPTEEGIETDDDAGSAGDDDDVFDDDVFDDDDSAGGSPAWTYYSIGIRFEAAGGVEPIEGLDGTYDTAPLWPTLFTPLD